MMNFSKMLLAAVTLFSIAGLCEAQDPAAKPKLKVVQDWDDSLTTDIPLVELLKKYHAKATFNIIPQEKRGAFYVKKQKEGPRVPFSFMSKGDSTEGAFQVEHLAISEMPEIYKGFKVAAHCGITNDETEKASESRMRTLLKTKALIRESFGQEVAGYAYPGGGYSPSTMADVEKAGYVYGRTIRSSTAPLPLDKPFEQPVSCHWTSPEFWKRYEDAKAKGGVFYFWGHSCELGDDPELWAWLESIYQRISSDPEVEWADVVDVFAKPTR